MNERHDIEIKVRARWNGTMLRHNVSPYTEFPYMPLPNEASRAARICITKLQFPENSILKDYSFASKEVGKPLTVNLLAFTHPIHRNPEYAGITVLNTVNAAMDAALVRTLAASAAPFHIIHHQQEEQFSFWTSAIDNAKEIIPKLVEHHISYDQLDRIMDQYAVDVKPQRILDVKQGRDTFTLPIFRDLQPLQLTLWAADVTGELLVNHFATVVELLRGYARNQLDIRANDEPITRLAIQLLGATILADTGVLDDNRDELRLGNVSLEKLITKAHAKFGSYFQLDLFEKYYVAAEEAYKVLRGINYAGFVPDMLTKIYTTAYSQEQRKKLGRFDTPLYLTRRIWENIPVEFLPPEQRYIADMTCGWGSFLISAHRRLSTLTDSPPSLRDYLRGNDIDPFTAQLAGLGLLLSTSEDSWRIDHGDALEWEWVNKHQPNIIVGNPPFGTQQGSAEEDEDGWYEEANKFLNHAITQLKPNGYLAMLMPRSFTTAKASPLLRRKLLETCDILELWELPTDVFPDATVRTMVLFAQKQDEGKSVFRCTYPTTIRTVQRGTLNIFKDTGIYTASSLSINQSKWNEQSRLSKNNTYVMNYQTLLPEYLWQSISSYCTVLEKVAYTIKGSSRGKEANRKKGEAVSSKPVPFLTGVKGVIDHSWMINYQRATTLIYPDDLERPRLKDEALLAGAKVLIVYDMDPSWGKRVKLAIERKAHYVSDSYWVVVPKIDALKQNLSHEVLAGILSWDVSNAWIIGHMKSPSIPSYAIKTAPIPGELSLEDCSALEGAVLTLEKEAQMGRFSSLATEEANLTIDAILKVAYHLDDATFKRLRKISQWDKQPELTLDPQPLYKSDYCLVSGVVDSVDAEKGLIKLWLEGFGELPPAQIVPTMPGWLLRPEAAFRAKVPYSAIEQGHIHVDLTTWGAFYPQPYAYLESEELLEQFSNIFYEEDKNSVR